MTNPFLTTRMRRLIEKIDESEEQEIIRASPGGWWVDNDRVFAPDAFKLLRYCLIRREGMARDDFERYHLAPEALKMLTDADHVPTIIQELRKHPPSTI